MSVLPTYADIVSLHRKYAPSDEAFDFIFSHCQIIWELAEQLIQESNLQLDVEQVKVGCLLHDIGVYELYLPGGEIDHANYIKHGTLGYELLKSEGFSESICRIASCHTGVGLSKEEIIKEGIPILAADYFAQTPEEQLVMYVDKFHTKTNPPKFVTSETCEKRIVKFGEAKVKRFQEFQVKFGVPDLRAIAKRNNSLII